MKFSQLLKKVDIKTLLLGILLGLIICRNIWCGCCLKEDFREGMDHDGEEEEEGEEGMDHDGEGMGHLASEREGMDHDGEGMGHEGGEGMGHDENEGMDHDGGVEEEEEEKPGIAKQVENFATRMLSKFQGREGFAGIGAPVMQGVEGSYEQVGTKAEWRENAGTAHQGTPVPLPSGEMFFFAGNKFTPNCRSSYSSSTGQACLSNEQIQYLNQRAGNRTLSDDM